MPKAFFCLIFENTTHEAKEKEIEKKVDNNHSRYNKQMDVWTCVSAPREVYINLSKRINYVWPSCLFSTSKCVNRFINRIVFYTILYIYLFDRYVFFPFLWVDCIFHHFLYTNVNIWKFRVLFKICVKYTTIQPLTQNRWHFLHLPHYTILILTAPLFKTKLSVFILYRNYIIAGKRACRNDFVNGEWKTTPNNLWGNFMDCFVYILTLWNSVPCYTNRFFSFLVG